MRFSLRAVFVGIALIAALTGWLVAILRETDLEGRSSGNIVSFRNAKFAQAAGQLDFDFTIEDIAVEVEGQFAGQGDLAANETSFVFGVSGTTSRSFPGLEVYLPYTKDELVQRIEREIDNRLGGKSGATISTLTLPYAGRT